MFNHVRRTNKGSHVSVQQEHCYAKTLASNFEIQVTELVHKIKFLNEKLKAGGICEHISNWKGLTSNTWILKIVRRAHIETEHLESVPLSIFSADKFLSTIEKICFKQKLKYY